MENGVGSPAVQAVTGHLFCSICVEQNGVEFVQQGFDDF